MNNLKALMRTAGISGVKMAELRGITPETVSRHVTSKTQMRMEDLVAYSEILNCKAEEILFEQKPLTIFGIANGQHIVTPVGPLDNACVYTNIGDSDEMVCIIKRNGANAWNQDTIYFVEKHPIQNRYVDSAAINKLAVYKVADQQNSQERLALGDIPSGQIGFGIIFQDPINALETQATYSIRDLFTAGAGLNHVELEWATPVLLQTYQNEKLGIGVE